MINRLLYTIQNIPPEERKEDIISHIEAQTNYGELTVYASSDHAAISLTIPRLYTYQYKDYFLEVIPINNHLYITCNKITSGLLTEKYRLIREKLSTLNTYLSDFEKELRIKDYHSRRESKLRTEETIKTLKRDIKSELTRLGIDIKPGSTISKLLKL